MSAPFTTLPQKLGIIAGGGTLPIRLAEFCERSGIETFIVGFDGHAEEALMQGRAHLRTRLGAAGAIMGALRERGIRDLVIIGAVKRPKFTEMMPDLRTAAFLAKLGLRALGDDGLLKAVRAELEHEGFAIHGVHELMPELVMTTGVLTQAQPDSAQRHDIAFGLSESRVLGRADIGQCVVVLNGKVLGREDDAGTNALIKRAGAKGAILVKSSKPQQDRKLDMPTIGPETVTLCAALGYAGIAAEAGGVLLAERDEALRLADTSGLFVVGV